MQQKSQVKFIYYFIGVFSLIFILLYSAGLVPEIIRNDDGDSVKTLWDKAKNDTSTDQPIIYESPVRIVIDKIGVDSIVSNPNTTDVTVLDEYLKQGTVRYPGSGLLGSGNMFIFGHSTGIKVVQNQAYKAFNGLKDLRVGDEIRVYSVSKTYIYKVTSVVLVDENKALVEFGNNKNMLTLSTCNTFGAKSERYVVEADLVE